jgi:hypothetical protein
VYAVAFVTAACWLLGPVAGVAFAQGVAALNGPGELGPMRLVLGDLTVESPAGCSVAYTLQVLTEVGPTSDDFELQVYDDGVLTQIVALSAPADGLLHDLSGTIELDQPVSQANPGIGVYLVDSETILDFVDPVNATCGVVEIPTLGSVGAWLLGGLLLASGVLVLRRTRRAF